MPDTTRAEVSFATHGEPFSVVLSPVPMRDYLAFRRDWSTEGSLDDFEASIARFARVAGASCGCGQPLEDHDLTTVRALVSFWIERMWEVAPPLPVESSGPTTSPGDSTPTAARSSRRRS